MDNKILVMKFGYSMILNSFYKVLRETKGQAIVQQIGSKTVESKDGFTGYEVPDETEQNINFKVHKVVRKERPDGSVIYRGKMGHATTYTLKEVKEGERFYFDHLD